MNDPSNPENRGAVTACSPIEECDKLIERFRRKATTSQRLAWLASLAIVLSSVSIPVCIVISAETGAFVFGKLLPSLLAALAALSAGAAQIVRPHDRWRINRRLQRLLEAERMEYAHRIGDYATGNPDQLLVQRLAIVRRSYVDEWLTIVPADTAHALGELGKPAN